MADVTAFNVGGTAYSMQDATARSTATAASTSAEYNRQELNGVYAGQNLATLLAGEIASGKTVYDALHARVKAANFAGLRVGDYMDVTLVSASAVTTAQSVRFLLAHIDPYYQCGDTVMGHHLAFVASAPIAVASTVEGVQNTSYLQWNTTATNNGTADQPNPYLASNLKAWEELFLATLPQALQDVLLNPRFLLETRYSASGALTESASWAWASAGKVFSLSEKEIWGCHEWSQPGYGGGIDRQWDIFKHGKNMMLNGSRISWWSRSVVSGSSSDVCFVSLGGFAGCASATYGWVRPRPGFLLG